MKWNYKQWAAASLVPQVILVKLLGSRPDWIERYYSQGLYPYISSLSRTLSGWLPFSVGDVLYAFFIGLLVWRLVKYRKKIRKNLLGFGRDVLALLAAVYFCFHLLWGFNYYRQPIAEKIGIAETSELNDVITLSEQLIAKTNTLQLGITQDSTQKVVTPYTKREIYEMSAAGYEALQKRYPFLAYGTPSIKSSLFSLGLSYSGYGGYLNPFTNEAQVNGRIPNFRTPITTTHEMGHQIGYAAENETNFVGYLAARAHPDPYFRYSAHAFALGYCLGTLQRKDPDAFKKLLPKLNAGVRANFKEVSDFWAQYENPGEPYLKKIYSTFLKANNQKKGILSYRSVVGLLVAYHKKHPV